MDLAKTRLFVLGKNRELSIAELLSRLETEGAAFRLRDVCGMFVIVDSDKFPDIRSLGGTIKVVRPYAAVPRSDVEKYFRDASPASIFRSPADGMTFGVSLYGTKNTDPRLREQVAMAVKERLKDAGLRSRFLPSDPDAPWQTHVEVIKRNMIEHAADICICVSNEKAFIGATEQVHDPFVFQRHDVSRPHQRPSLSMAPRLAKILVNLTGAQKRLLDPFCGIGTLVQEALDNGLDAAGTDYDHQVADMCLGNIDWLCREQGIDPKKAEIAFQDATKLSERFPAASFDGIACEPPLGPLLKRRPGYEEAVQIIAFLESTYRKAIAEMAKVLAPGGQVAMTFPRFNTWKGPIRMAAESIAKQNGFEVYDVLQKYKVPHTYPVFEAETRHNLIREVHVFRKVEG